MARKAVTALTIEEKYKRLRHRPYPSKTFLDIPIPHHPNTISEIMSYGFSAYTDDSDHRELANLVINDMRRLVRMGSQCECALNNLRVAPIVLTEPAVSCQVINDHHDLIHALESCVKAGDNMIDSLSKKTVRRYYRPAHITDEVQSTNPTSSTILRYSRGS